MRFLTVAIFLFLFTATAFAGAIDRVEVTGNRRVPEARIRQYLVKAGDNFDPEKINISVKQLHSTGFFMEVTVDAEVRGNEFVITYILQETPLVASIEVNGSSHFNSEKLEEAYAIKIGSTLNLLKVGNTIRNLQVMYEKDRFYSVEITHRVEYRNETSVNLVFDIKEGEKSRVYNIWFYGNENVSADELHTVMKTKEKDFWSLMNSSGTIITDIVEYDREMVRELYLSKGYATVSIGEPEIAFQSKNERLNYLIRINEGPRYTVKNIEYADSKSVYTSEEMKALTKLREGESFNVSLYREDIRRLTDAYSERGYARANVDADVSMDRQEHTVSINYVVEEGPIVYINRIIFEGNDDSRDNILRRQFDISEGEKYNSKLLREAEYNLYNTGFYENIQISEQTVADNKTDIRVRVTEKKSGSLNLGITYSSNEDQLGGHLELAKANIFGFGSTLSARAMVTAVRNEYSISFTEPWMLDNPYLVGFDLYSRTYEDDERGYTRMANGASIRLGHQLIKRRLYLNYAFAHEEVSMKDIRDNASKYIINQEGLHIINAVTLSATLARMNNSLDPTDGYKLTGRAEFGGTFLGGTEDYSRATLEGSYYIPLFYSFVGVAHAEGGQIWSLTKESMPWKLTKKPIPADKRFYLGGMYSVRGFRTSEISPTDDDGYVYGGDKYYQVNLEIWRPIFEGNLTVRGVIFMDMGQAYDEEETMFSYPPRKSIGGGVRFFTPMGLIRLECGYKLDKREGESQYNWEFTVGSTF
ncbi:MAG: outer membrane protein assembly factor BamA [Deferribacteraceae bacterium]|jgi:outer membrane protein insertion porin family|nr:outer membrane protein assembly factor BamA [Deferribacteraceae bacterium]